MKRDNKDENQYGLAVICPVDSLMLAFPKESERSVWFTTIQSNIELFNQSYKFREGMEV